MGGTIGQKTRPWVFSGHDGAANKGFVRDTSTQTERLLLAQRLVRSYAAGSAGIR